MVRCFSFSPYGTNTYLITNEKNAVIIDAAADAQALLAEVEKHKLFVRAVLLTHSHFDHIDAVDTICNATSAPLYIHTLETKALQDPIANASALLLQENRTVNTVPKTLSEGQVLSFGSLCFRVLHTPGHTAGSVCYYQEQEGILFSGDTLFCGSIGRMDLPSGNQAQMKESLARLCTLPPKTIVYPGHAQKTTIAQEIAHNPYIKAFQV